MTLINTNRFRPTGSHVWSATYAYDSTDDFTQSYHEAGTYAGGEYNLSCVLYQQSSVNREGGMPSHIIDRLHAENVFEIAGGRNPDESGHARINLSDVSAPAPGGGDNQPQAADPPAPVLAGGGANAEEPWYSGIIEGLEIAASFFGDLYDSLLSGASFDSLTGGVIEAFDQAIDFGYVSLNTLSEFAYHLARLTDPLNPPRGGPLEFERSVRLTDLYAPMFGNVDAFEEGRVVGAHTFHVGLFVAEAFGVVAAATGITGLVGVAASGATGIGGIAGGAGVLSGSASIEAAVAATFSAVVVVGTAAALTNWDPFLGYHFNYIDNMQPSASA